MHTRSCHSTEGLTPASVCGGKRLMPRQSVWNLWWRKGRWERFFSEHIGFFKSITIPPKLHLFVISKRWVKLPRCTLWRHTKWRHSATHSWGGQLHNATALPPRKSHQYLMARSYLHTRPDLEALEDRKISRLFLESNHDSSDVQSVYHQGDGQCEQYRLQFQGKAPLFHPKNKQTSLFAKEHGRTLHYPSLDSLQRNKRNE